MVGRPQKRTEKTRSAILSAARGLFEKEGFETTSVEAIAAEAGIAKATVFAHFGDKSNLLIALKLDDLQGLLRDMQDRVDAGPASADGTANAHAYLTELLMPWLRVYRSDPEFGRLLLTQTTLKDGPFTRQFLDVCMEMEGKLEAGFTRLSAAAALPASAEPALLTQGVLAFFYHIIVGQTTGALANEEAQDALFKGLLQIWLTGAQTPHA